MHSLISEKSLKTLMLYSNNPFGKLNSFICGYIAISIVVGWKTLNKLSANYFLFLPIIGWIIYFSIKLYAATLIGFFYTPVWFIKKFMQLIKLAR
jgi:hypothetical protein